MSVASRRRWTIDDIPWDSIDVESVRSDEFLLLTLASASLVEVLAENYSHNLVDHFSDSPDLSNWLSEHWRLEEENHGKALKTYVCKVWPEFNWERAHQSFKKDYLELCTMEELEKHRALELVARCVIETGTSTLYRTLQNYASEPVLRQLLNRIKMDETAHYNQFRKHFNAYNAVEGHGLRKTIPVIYRRLAEIKQEDAYIAFKYAYLELHPGSLNDIETAWAKHRKTTQQLARRYYPFGVAASMLLKPLPTSDSLKSLLRWPLAGLAYLMSYRY